MHHVFRPRGRHKQTTGTRRESSHQRRSYGIVCFDKHSKRILCVRKAFTYAITALVTGSYQDTPEVIKELFNELTDSERRMLKDSHFETLLNHIFYDGGGNITPEAKNHMGRIFTKRWNSTTITEALQKCEGVPGNLLWEIPKGHWDRNKDLNKRDSAIREFMEETQLPREDFTMCKDIPPFIDSHTDGGITYTVQYWFATQNHESTHKLQVNYSPESNNYLEVSAISWLNLDELRSKQCIRYLNRSLELFKRLIKHYYHKCAFIENEHIEKQKLAVQAIKGVRRRRDSEPS